MPIARIHVDLVSDEVIMFYHPKSNNRIQTVQIYISIRASMPAHIMTAWSTALNRVCMGFERTKAIYYYYYYYSRYTAYSNIINDRMLL